MDTSRGLTRPLGPKTAKNGLFVNHFIREKPYSLLTRVQKYNILVFSKLAVESRLEVSINKVGAKFIDCDVFWVIFED